MHSEINDTLLLKRLEEKLQTYKKEKDQALTELENIKRERDDAICYSKKLENEKKDAIRPLLTVVSFARRIRDQKQLVLEAQTKYRIACTNNKRENMRLKQLWETDGRPGHQAQVKVCTNTKIESETAYQLLKTASNKLRELELNCNLALVSLDKS